MLLACCQQLKGTFTDNSVMTSPMLCCSCRKTKEEVDTGVTAMDAAKDVRQLLNWWLSQPRAEMKMRCWRYKKQCFLWWKTQKASQIQLLCHRFLLTGVDGKQQTCFRSNLERFFIRLSPIYRWLIIFLGPTAYSSNAPCEIREPSIKAVLYGKMCSPLLSHHSDMCSED